MENISVQRRMLLRRLTLQLGQTLEPGLERLPERQHQQQTEQRRRGQPELVPVAPLQRGGGNLGREPVAAGVVQPGVRAVAARRPARRVVRRAGVTHHQCAVGTKT